MQQKFCEYVGQSDAGFLPAHKEEAALSSHEHPVTHLCLYLVSL